MDTRQCTAILHLATGSNNKQAADAAGVSLSTVEKWKQKADFQSLLQEAIHHIYATSVAELAKGVLQSAEELRRIATSSESSDRVKIAAITVLFGQLEKFKSWELESRLTRIEAKLDGTYAEEDFAA